MGWTGVMGDWGETTEVGAVLITLCQGRMRSPALSLGAGLGRLAEVVFGRFPQGKATSLLKQVSRRAQLRNFQGSVQSENMGSIALNS